MSEPQPGKPKINLDVQQLVNLSCNILQQIFFKQKEEKAKRAFKNLKRGERLSLGDITLKRDNEAEGSRREARVPLLLELDYSEFRGPGFSFPVYKTALRAMLERIATRMRARKDLNLFTSEQTGGVLIHQPGVIRTGDHINVLLLSMQSDIKARVVLRLLFVDADQYQVKESDDSKYTAGQES